MALARHELEVATFPVPGGVRERVGRRARIQAVREEAATVEQAKVVFLRESGIVERLKDLAPSLPGRVRISVSKPEPGQPINVIASFNPHFSFRDSMFDWERIAAEVVDGDGGGYALKINGMMEGAQHDQNALLTRAADVHHMKYYEVLGGRRSGQRQVFLSERFGRGREKIEVPKARRRWFPKRSTRLAEEVVS